jgi:hypothetical protein
MLPYMHVILSLIVSLVLYAIKVNPFFILLFFLASVLIDFDHYILYVIRKKKFNPFRAYSYFRDDAEKELLKEGKKRVLFVFHNLEILLALLILSFFIRFFVPILLGYAFHLIIDIINEQSEKVKKSWSIIYHISK